MALREIKALYLVLASAALLLCNKGECSSFGARRGLAAAVETVFDVTKFGARPDGRTDGSLQMIRAWNAACKSGAPAKLVFPPGKFVAGEVVFQGPCTTTTPITIEIQGTILSSTDLSVFTQGVWISIENVNGVIVTGGGTLDGRGASAWEYAGGDGAGLLPVSLQMLKVQNGVIQNINLLNSKGFHSKVTWSANITVSDLTITAPADSPNTDGLHISSSQNVNVTNLTIATGDDCISVGEGNTNIAISKVTCGPGHGISIGSLGKRPAEKDVNGVTVTNCTLTGTTNGARIKTYHASPPMRASGIVYEDIIMNGVRNPIIIDQHYNSGKKDQPSRVQITDVHFRNIRGTSASPVAVNLDCSQAVPCQGVELADIDLAPAPGVAAISSACINTKPTLGGKLSLGQGGCQQ
nr:exopolygalacturonase clone GBGE184-like [Coffea arabica]